MDAMFLDEQGYKVWFEVSDNRLAKLVLDVWNALPVDAKIDASKRINKITDNEYRGAEDVAGDMAFCVFMPWGNEIYFFSQDYGGVSDGFLKHTIAHEIAHGIFHSPNLRDDESMDRKQEQEADQIATDWGFPNPYLKSDDN